MRCWNCQSEVGAADVCPSCGKVQPVAPGTTLFEVLGLPRGVDVDKAELERAYRDLERHRSPLLGPPRSMLQWLRRFRVDHTKLADEVSHITKFVGDWHLAGIYLGASERFHLPQWQQSVEQRLTQLDQVYQLIQADVYERRMLWLEVAIVVLFIIDLLAIFFWKGA